MSKRYIVEYLEQYKDHEPWSIDVIDSDILKEVEDKCIIKEELNYSPKSFKANTEISSFNILGFEYRDVVDVIIPTKHISNIKSLRTLRELEKNWVINLFVVEATFNEENGWFAANVNRWARLDKWTGKYILILNDDVVLDYHDILRMKKEMVNWVWIVGANCSKTEWWVNGSMMMIPRRLFEDIGWFDERYFFMWEDNDICENVKRRWFKIVIADTYSIHEWWDSLDTESKIWQDNYFKWKELFIQKWNSNNNLIGSMIVWDEDWRYLDPAITSLFERMLVDRLVIVLDKSNIETLTEIIQIKNKYNLDIKLYYHDFKLFWDNENVLRERAISYAISENPYWIVVTDADEVLDIDLDRKKIFELLEKKIWIDFKIAHFWWDWEHVRVDEPYASQKNIRIFRYEPELWYSFYNRNIHCGSAPIYAYENRVNSGYILYHYWYARKEDIKEKVNREKEYDKGMLENPKFVEWLEKEPKLQKFNELTFLKTWIE